MPFPLREDFLGQPEESLHLPIWVPWPGVVQLELTAIAAGG